MKSRVKPGNDTPLTFRSSGRKQALGEALVIYRFRKMLVFTWQKRLELREQVHPLEHHAYRSRGNPGRHSGTYPKGRLRVDRPAATDPAEDDSPRSRRGWHPRPRPLGLSPLRAQTKVPPLLTGDPTQGDDPWTCLRARQISGAY